MTQAERGFLLANCFNLGMEKSPAVSKLRENPPFHTGIISEPCEASLFCFATAAVIEGPNVNCGTGSTAQMRLQRGEREKRERAAELSLARSQRLPTFC